MKDIGIYFSDFGSSETFKPEQIGSVIHRSSELNFLLPEKNSIAILFVPDAEVSRDQAVAEVNVIRSSFYNLFAAEWKISIYDLGVIHPGETQEDTFAALRDVVTELIKNEVFPVVIGGGQELTYPVYQAYEKLEQTVNLLDIDASLDLGDPEDEISERAWLNKIILHKPGYLFNYSLVGFQSYLVAPGELKLLDKMYFDAFRLGEFYQDDKMVEPLVRNADILSIDLDSIRSSDFLANSRALPHGLYGEDACKVMRYAGLSDKLTSLGLFGFRSTPETIKNDANLVAQMLWYFIEGYNQRKRDYPIGSKAGYTRYRVVLDDFKDEINFYKSDKSGRWWMEVPYPKVAGVKFQRHLLVPCNYDVYQNALNNEMPNLWWKTYMKLS